MDAVTAKTLSLFILLVETCVCGLLPMGILNVLKRFETVFTRTLELANLFAGGVFLATLLLHLAPEATETLKNAFEESGLHIDYPVAEILVAGGFFLIAVVEQVAFCFHHSPPQDCQDQTGQDSRSSSQEDLAYYVNPSCSAETVSDCKDCSQRDSLVVQMEHSSKSKDMPPTDQIPSENVVVQIDHISSSKDMPPINQEPSESQTTVENSCSHAPPISASEAHDHIVSTTTSPKTITVRSLIFFLALSLHSLFEGMAIGLQDTVSGVWETLLAVAIHKGVIAFSFTFSMTEQSIRSSIIAVYIVAFAIISPVGIGIGIIISEKSSGTAADLANGILQSIAAGTFLFVVFFEILPRELHCHDRLRGVVNLLFTLVGFGLMAGLEAVGSHEHSHGGEE